MPRAAPLVSAGPSWPVMPPLDAAECRRRFAAVPRVVLGTHGPAGRLDLVPVTFAVVDETVVSAVDHKPKSTRRLQRLADIGRDPQVTLLADRYTDDWEDLWWVRAQGRAAVRDGVPPPVLDALVARYLPYRERLPVGPFIVVTVERWTGWEAAVPGDAPPPQQ
jgi:PPOX class probable F420-dependent enzyme